MMNRPALVAVFLFLVVMLPLAVPSRAIQSDEEAHWQHRTLYFLQAMQTRDFAATVQTEHPGMTTVALGALGREVWRITGGDFALMLPEYLRILRFPVKVVNALLVALGYLVMRRLFTPGVAFWGALLWATSPYLRWHMRLLHIDGMSTNFMMLAFLLMLFALRFDDDEAAQPPRWWWLIVAGVAGGLATLTRFSSVYLIGVAGLLALMTLWAGWRGMTWRAFGTRIALPVVAFTAVMVITWTALYPGMWTNARGVYEQTLHGVDNAVNPHDGGNFFMGAVVDDPGAWFYPVALVFRMSPFALAGVILAAAGVILAHIPKRSPGTGLARQTPGQDDALPLPERVNRHYRVWVAVMLYAVLYLVFLTVQGKKFDRYALPAYPALHVMAAAGWVWLGAYVAKWMRERGWQRVGARLISPLRIQRIGGGRMVQIAAVIVVIGHALWFLPNEFAYVNPLLGGARAERVLLIGGGEGLQGISAALDGVCDATIAAPYSGIVWNYTPCNDVTDIDDLSAGVIAEADYIVNYASYRQRQPDTQAVFVDVEPLYTARYNGITYFELYDAAQIRAERDATP